MTQAPNFKQELSPGARVLIRAFEDIPEHIFEVSEVYEDCIGGYSLTGPLTGEYGEPDFEMILRIID